MTELIQAGIVTTLIQNVVYATPGKSCLLFCSTAGAAFEQSNSATFADSKTIPLTSGEGVVGGAFIRSTAGDAAIILKVIASGSYYLTPGFQPGLWDDISLVPATGVNPNGPDAPATVIIDPAGYFGALQFDAIGESAAVIFQLPHTYQLGTDIRPHIHIVRNDAADNTGDCEFTANFRVVPLIGTAFAWTGMVAGDVTLQPADGANNSGIIEWTLLDATYSFNISYLVLMTIRRSGLATKSLAMLSCDIHGRKAQFGSTTEGAI